MSHYLDRDEVSKKHTLCTKAIALKAMDAEDNKIAENAHEAVMHVLMDYDFYADIDKIIFESNRGPDVKAPATIDIFVLAIY